MWKMREGNGSGERGLAHDIPKHQDLKIPWKPEKQSMTPAMEVQSTFIECLAQEGSAGCHRQRDRARVDHSKGVTKGEGIGGRGRVPGWC